MEIKNIIQKPKINTGKIKCPKCGISYNAENIHNCSKKKK